jgi:hypothetical protein
MSRISSTEKNDTERAEFAAQALVSHREQRQNSSDYQVLYVLGFGVAGAILANMTLFIYFMTRYASG